MIVRLDRTSGLCDLPENGVEALKIRALAEAYGIGYEFCRFYRQGHKTFMAMLDSEAVLCEGDGADYEELAEFSAMSVSSVFCSERAADELCRYAPFKREKLLLMKKSRSGGFDDISNEVYAPQLDELYAVLKTSFDIPFETWYADISHRTRHGISLCRMLGGCSALVVQHNIGGEALLSQVATIPDERGKGRASALIRSVCAELYPSDVFVLCAEETEPFYIKCGFSREAVKYALYRSGTI